MLECENDFVENKLSNSNFENENEFMPYKLRFFPDAFWILKNGVKSPYKKNGSANRQSHFSKISSLIR